MDKKQEYQIDFLKYAIKHIENRIAMIDQRCSMLIAANGVFLAVNKYISENLFKGLQEIYYLVAMGFAFLFFIATIFMMLKSIRPTNFPLGFKIRSDGLPGRPRRNFLWPKEGFCENPDHFIRDIEDLDESEILHNFQSTNFALLKHLNTKMGYYERAVFLMKLFVLYCFLSSVYLFLISRSI